MKRKIALWAGLLLSFMLVLSACGQETLNCTVVVLNPTTFTEKEIDQALRKVQASAAAEFSESALKELAYDESMQYPSGETMVIRAIISKDGSSDTRQWTHYNCMLNRSGKDWAVEIWSLVP